MIVEKLKALLPHFLFEIVPTIKKIIPFLTHFASAYLPKIKITAYKIIGYFKHYFSIVLGVFTAFFIHLRSDEFKQNKYVIIKRHIKFYAENPKDTFLRIFSVAAILFISFIIFNNTKTVVVGAHKLRAPASARDIEYAPENEIELKNHKFEVALGEKGGSHGGAGKAHTKEEILLDVTIEAASKEQMKFLKEAEKSLLVELEAFEFNISSLPLSDEEKKNNEKKLTAYLNHEFFRMAHDQDVIKKISLKQSPKRRPAYFDQGDRLFAMKDVNLQIFLEDTSRNRQVIFDYSLLASNRNIVLYFKDHEDKVRDRLSTQIEPIIPRLPIEDEGKSIIKDKIRSELNELLKEEKIEGRVLEVYLDYILGS